MLKMFRLSLVWIAIAGLIGSPLFLSGQETHPKLSEEQLDTLLAPIALYPDPLLAQILPASTSPSDIVLAARYVAAKKDESKIDSQPWEESVKALARYPDVLKMMDEKLDWTTELGQAFIDQPNDVYDAVQRLRAKAKSVGNLKDTPQQVVVVEKEVIKIMPADPQVIYVPQYQPSVVYVQQPPTYVAPIITFGAGLALGLWIHNELDWHSHSVYYHNSGWHGGYYGGGNYHGGGNNINIDNSNNINIGNGNGNRVGNGNNGSVWKPQNKSRPETLPSYGNNNGNRPGAGNGNGSKWPNGSNNGQPGNGNGLGSGNQRPSTKPGQEPGIGGANRPSGNDDRQKPSTLPAKPQNSDQGNRERPTTRPAQQPTTRPAQQPGNNFSREGSKPRSSGGNQGGATSRPAGGNRGGASNNAGGGGGRLAR